MNNMKLRIQITKDAGIRFISHLEYVRTIERAIRRAKLPVCYSEGFNPHMKFSLASALGVGVTSITEFVEVELAEVIELSAAMEQLKKALPMGIRIIAADIVGKNTAKLMAQAGGATYHVSVPCVAGPWEEAVAKFNEAASVLFQKPIPKGRGKTKEIEVKDFIPKVAVKQVDGSLIIDFSCKITPNGSMKATELLKILKTQFAIPLEEEKADILRTELFAVDKKGRKQPLLNNEYLA